MIKKVSIYKKIFFIVALLFVGVVSFYFSFEFYSVRKTEAYFENVNEKYYYGNEQYQYSIINASLFSEELKRLDEISFLPFINSYRRNLKQKVYTFYIDRCSIDYMKLIYERKRNNGMIDNKSVDDFCSKWRNFLELEYEGISLEDSRKQDWNKYRNSCDRGDLAK